MVGKRRGPPGTAAPVLGSHQAKGCRGAQVPGGQTLARSVAPQRGAARQTRPSSDKFSRITARQADVYCFSPYWVGSLAGFQRLAWVAEYEGLQVCKHTHGELGVAAAAVHHVVLTLPNGVDGHQQTAHVMEHDVLTEPIPIATGPCWGAIDAPGLGVEVDESAVADAAARYRADGQYRPWQHEQLAKEDR